MAQELGNTANSRNLVQARYDLAVWQSLTGKAPLVVRRSAAIVPSSGRTNTKKYESWSCMQFSRAFEFQDLHESVFLAILINTELRPEQPRQTTEPRQDTITTTTSEHTDRAWYSQRAPHIYNAMELGLLHICKMIIQKCCDSSENDSSQATCRDSKRSS